MTDKQFLDKVDELSVKTAIEIRARARKLLKSGRIDLDKWMNDYQLAKIVTSVACEEMAFQWQPLNKNNKDEMQNIRHFI